MDADRFDTIARNLGAPTSRRRALGASLAGGLLGALGLARSSAPASAAQGGVCTLALTANVRLGPSLSEQLTSAGQPGELRGNLTFSLDQSGRFVNAEMQAESGERYPVVGQATGYSLQARINAAPGLALVLCGVGEQEIAVCQGAVDGCLSGPQAGDIGDWHADATGGGTARQGGQSTGSGTTRSSGNASSGNSAQPRATTTGTAPACPAGQTRCPDGACRDLNTDATNCGACGNICPINNCTAGVCVTAGPLQNCGVPYAFCGTICIDPRSDPANCGRCGLACASGEVCVSGACTPGTTGAQCAPGLTLCGNECIDTRTNVLHCGGCGQACGERGTNCENGQCFIPDIACPAGTSQCGLVCCNADEVCVIGECAPRPIGTCPSGLTDCGGTCTDTASDNVNCGGCGLPCEEGTTCQGGECAPTGGGGCRAGLMDCSGTCIDPGFDNANCGGCGLACAEGTVCSIGACIPIDSGGGGCKTGLTGCGGVCVDFNTDAANCGGCGQACASGETCAGGQCTATTTEAPPPTCADQGLIECFGSCTDLQTDPSNCGFCGTACPSGQCATGTCIEVVGPAPQQVGCQVGQEDCGAGCIDVFTDPANCGFCGNVCAGDQQCLFGQCAGFDIPIP